MAFTLCRSHFVHIFCGSFRNKTVGSSFICSKRLMLTALPIQEPLYDVIEVRRQLKERVAQSYGDVEQPTSQDQLPKKCMIDSYRQAVIPLKSKPKFHRNNYINFHKTVRIGKILEALDTMAVWIGYTHNTELQTPISIVTAFVDNIALRPNSLHQDADILISGHVTWVGSSSMAITMNVKQERDNKWNDIVDAHFVMVARNPQTKQKALVCPLNIETEEEKRLFNQGKEYMDLAKEQSHQSLVNVPPTESEKLLIHDLFKATLDPKAATFRNPRKPEGAVWMEATKLKNLVICFPEQRNLYNKMFGGFLMRMAYELGWSTAIMYCKGHRIMATAMDDILFRKPVEIGSLLYLSAMVVYTSSNKLQVRVHAQVVDPNTGDQDTTNVFHFTFQSTQETDVATVMPNSYAEYMMYLDGKRHFDQHL